MKFARLSAARKPLQYLWDEEMFGYTIHFGHLKVVTPYTEVYRFVLFFHLLPSTQGTQIITRLTFRLEI